MQAFRAKSRCGILRKWGNWLCARLSRADCDRVQGDEADNDAEDGAVTATGSGEAVS